MKLRRRELLRAAAGAAALSAAARAAGAQQAYPTRPVRIVVGLPAGNSPDIIARLTAQWLSQRLDQAFVVENRPGAATGIATEFVVRAPADGYTLLLALAGNAVNGWVFKLHYDFIRDIAPVASIGGIPLAMVINLALPVQSVPEFIAYAKANPGKLLMASSGNGSLPHILGVMFAMQTGVELVHVPYKESVFPDLLGGQTQLAFEPVPAVIGYIRSGQLRGLAVSTSQRLDVLPDLPTIGEFLPGYEATGWIGLGAPSNTPADIIGTLNSAVNAGLADSTFSARLRDLSVIPDPMTAAGFTKFIADETAKWQKVVDFARIKVE
jgi:tripartite-type tricarboxylate transporter receptor subunit TctC